jgi:mannose-6-phosphate isomerase-like protein (cupin superfamily)
MKISIQNALHYKWGEDCDGWHLLQSETLSVIQESMPAGTAEGLHFHKKSQQLFYILTGTATFHIGEQIHQVSAGESIHIPQETKHLIMNETKEVLGFLVISEPKSHGDRVNI